MKIVVGFFLILFMMFIGLAAGTAIGANFFVTKADGMAGGAIALSYGALGMLITLVAAIIMLRKMQPKHLQISVLITGVLALSASGTFYYRYKKQHKERMEQQEKENERYKNLKPTEVAPDVN